MISLIRALLFQWFLRGASTLNLVWDNLSGADSIYIPALPCWMSSASCACMLSRSAAVAAKSLQSCLTLCDPIDGSPPGSSVLGFSRQEHWSGLPFPSPMHESEKWKCSCSVVSHSWWPHGLQPTRPLHPWDFPCKSTGVGCHCLLRLSRSVMSNSLQPHGL